MDPMTIMTAIMLGATLFQVLNGVIKFNQVPKLNAEQLIALRKEVKYNIEIVEFLLKKDKSVNAVYDPGIRKNIYALRFDELQKISANFVAVMEKQLKKTKNKTDRKKDSMVVFWNIKETVRKMEDLHKRMKRLPAKPTATAPRVLLSRRLPVLDRRLKELDEALKIIPIK